MSPNDRPEDEQSSERPVKVMVVDDQQAFRDVMRRLVQAAEGFTLVGEAASGEAALVAMDQLSPDFVVIDVRMPGMGGVAAAVSMLERYPDRVVLLVSLNDLTGAAPVGPCGAPIPFVCKSALRAHVLREVWVEYHHATRD
jgi:CheY-like chemotaxis protein